MAKRTDNFQKFVKVPKGRAIKEKIKQEKKKEKKERAVAIEEHFARKRDEKLRQRGIDPATVKARPGKYNKNKSTNKYAPQVASSNKEKAGNAFENKKAPAGKFEKKPYSAKSAAPREKRSGDERPGDENVTRSPKEKFEKRDASISKEKRVHPNSGKPPREKSYDGTKKFDSKKPLREGKKDYAAKPFTKNKSGGDGYKKPSPTSNGESYEKPSPASNGDGYKKRSAFIKPGDVENTSDNKVENPTRQKPVLVPHKKSDSPKEISKPETQSNKSFDKNVKGGKPQGAKIPPELMPLNKYIAHSGVCARRDAAELVKNGKVTVNDELITDPGTKVSQYDVVKVSGNTLTISKNFVYILLNKPKDYITTSDDPQGRKTVLDLVRTATSERVYPIGRLDRNTSGVLLLTNDGDLAQKLSHPKHEIKKVYEVRLDRNLTKHDMEKIAAGIILEDGLIAPDVIAYADSKDKSIIGIEIHSGRNRIVRRIFEHMKYDVKALDRVMFAGLTKKDVQRGNWRLLKEKEVRLLKYMNQSYVKSKD